MFFPYLLNRKSFVTELGELDKFFLNLLQSFLSGAVIDVGFRALLDSEPMPFIQLLNVSDYPTEGAQFFPEELQDDPW